MARQKVKRKLVKDFENHRAFCFYDLDDTYRIYCYIEDSDGFWNTRIHMAIDNRETKETDLYVVTCNMFDQEMFEKRIDDLIDYYENNLLKKSIEGQKQAARNINESLEHLIRIIEMNNTRFSFEFASGGEKSVMEIFDKDKEIGYVVKIEPLEYDENGEAVNL